MSGSSPDPISVPLVQEQLRVERREVETDRVRVRTIIEEVPVWRTEELERGELDVERVAVEHQVDAAPAPYEEDGVLVVPIVEERLVKQLFVVEELRIRRRTTVQSMPVVETLRRQRAVIERDIPLATGEKHG